MNRSSLTEDPTWLQGVMQEGYAAEYLFHKNGFTEVTQAFKVRYEDVRMYLTRNLRAQNFLLGVLASFPQSDAQQLLNPIHLQMFLRQAVHHLLPHEAYQDIGDVLEEFFGGPLTNRLASLDALITFALLDWYVELHRHNHCRPIPILSVEKTHFISFSTFKPSLFP